MDSWDDDDYDPTANAALADKIVTLGLDERLRAEKEESAEPADDKKTSNDKKSKKTAGRAGSEDVDLTEADRRRLQERSDRKLAADLFGKEAWEMRKKNERYEKRQNGIHKRYGAGGIASTRGMDGGGIAFMSGMEGICSDSMGGMDDGGIASSTDGGGFASMSSMEGRGIAYLSGIEDDSEPTFDDLETKAEFTEFAQRIGEMFAKRAKNEHYLHFVRELVKVTCAPMTKFQLETVQGVVKEYIDVHVKKENEAKKAEVPKVQKKAQKAKKKELYEDFGEDEYADYADLEDKF